MLGALIIVFREIFEAGLIVGIAMAVTRGIKGRGYFITGGIAAGVAGACLVAAFISTISSAFEGSGQELLNAGILGVAVVMLTWHNVWMARHGRELATEMREAGEAVRRGSSTLLRFGIVVAIAVLREGSEVALFLYGVVISSDAGSGTSIVIGGLLGLLLGATVTAACYWGLLQIPTRYLFAATSALIAFLAAGLASQAVRFLEQADIVTMLQKTLWDSSAILSEASLYGQALHTLIGYNDHPTAMEALAYLLTLAVIAGLMKLFAHPAPISRPAAA